MLSDCGRGRRHGNMSNPGGQPSGQRGLYAASLMSKLCSVGFCEPGMLVSAASAPAEMACAGPRAVCGAFGGAVLAYFWAACGS